MRAKIQNGHVVVRFTAAEASRLGITSKQVAAAAPVAKAAPSGKVICTFVGCYKEGHAFSQAGAFGDGLTPRVIKGHFDLNPTHTLKTV